MRDLIDKLTLLESDDTVSIQKIAKLLSPERDYIIFSFHQHDSNLPLELEEGPATITYFHIGGSFRIDENGHLTNYLNPKFITKIKPIPIDNLRNQMIVGKTAIKILKQFFGIDDADYVEVKYYEQWNNYLVNITNSREFLALIDAAYQWRQETIGDL